MSLKIPALIMFVCMYAVMIIKPKFRVHAAVVTAVLFIVLGILPIFSVPTAINWNVLMMLFGTMIVVDYFIASKMPNLIADVLLDHSKNVMWVTIYMSLFSGIVSAFIDNVATVLMVAPVGLAICQSLGISPIPMILCIAVSSNLQGAATLVGDTTSIMLGAYAGMDFNAFFFMKGRLGIFFAVELGALATIPIIMYLFRNDRTPVSTKGRTHTVVTDYFPTIMLISVVLCLILASFIPNKPEITNGLICLCIALITILVTMIRSHSVDAARHSIESVDFETLLLLVALFLVIAGITNVGIIDDFAAWIVKTGGNNLFLLYSIVVWGSVLISAFVDNIPYVATMLPVLQTVTTLLGIEPYVLYFGLLTGATLGGNLTPIGASANIAAVGILKKNGYETTFKDFMRIGVPFTLAAVLCGYLFIWFVWA
ncbi:MAG: arsenic transporter [Clostridia bacterium]|nr:arsenic transporter [Clostridia bacterium]